MMSDYIWYCNQCFTVTFNTPNAQCDSCMAKMKDIAFIKSIEDAIWWGQKHPEASIKPSISWEADNGYLNEPKDIGFESW